MASAIAEDHINTDIITRNIEESQPKCRLGKVSNRLPVVAGAGRGNGA